MSVNNLIEHLTLTEQEIIAIIRRNDEHFARRVLAFVFGLDKAMWKKKKDLELDVESIKGKEAVPFPFVRCWTSGWSAAPLLWRKPFNPRSVR